MKRQYVQIAQRTISSPTTPQSNMHSVYFDANDGGNLKRIDPAGISWPVGGIRKIDEGGQVGWTLAVDRLNKGNIGINALDFTLVNVITGVGATGDNSIAIGVDTTSSHASAVSIGHGVKSTGGVTLGRFNVGLYGNLFEIGDGSNDASRNNVFEIDANNVARLPDVDKGDITGDKDVVIKAMLDDLREEVKDYDEHTFAIKGVLSTGVYGAFMPYIPAGRTKKVVGFRWYLKTGSCNVQILERSDAASFVISGTLAINSPNMGQDIESVPANYYDLTDGRRVELQVDSVISAEDLSLTVILINA